MHVTFTHRTELIGTARFYRSRYSSGQAIAKKLGTAPFITILICLFSETIEKSSHDMVHKGVEKWTKYTQLYVQKSKLIKHAPFSSLDFGTTHYL